MREVEEKPLCFKVKKSVLFATVDLQALGTKNLKAKNEILHNFLFD